MIFAQGRQQCEQTYFRTVFQNLTALAGPPPHPGLIRRSRPQQAVVQTQHPRRRESRSVAARADGDGQAEGSKGLFGFVTDNPSSRSVRPCRAHAAVRAEGSLQSSICTQFPIDLIASLLLAAPSGDLSIGSCCASCG